MREDKPKIKYVKKLTSEMLNFIRLNLNKPDGKIAREIETVFDVSVTSDAIRYQKEKILDSLPELPSEEIQWLLDSIGVNTIVRYAERIYRMMVSKYPDAIEEELSEKTRKTVSGYLHDHPDFQPCIQFIDGLVFKRKTETKYPLKIGQKVESKLAELDKIALKNMNQEQLVEYIKLHRFISEEPEEENKDSIAIEAATTRFKRTGIIDGQFLTGKLSPDEIHKIKSSAGSPEEITENK